MGDEMGLPLAYSTRIGNFVEQAPLADVGTDAGEDPVKILLLGDSMTNDPIRARCIQRELSQLTSGFQFVGDIGLGAATGGIIGDRDMQWWTRSGVNGNTVAQITARIAALAVALGESRAPDIVVLLEGANNFSASTPTATTEANMRTQIELIRSTWDPHIILNAPAIISAGAGAGFEAKDTLRAEAAVIFEALCNEYPNVHFCDGLAGMTAAEQLPDGIHLNEYGAARVARAEAALIAEIMGRRAIVAGPVQPANGNCLVFDTPASDAATIASDADLAAGTESFLVSIRFKLVAYPPDGSVYDVISQGTTIPDGWTLGVFKVAGVAKAGLSWYLTHATSVISGNAGYPANLLELGEEYEVTVINDAAEDKVGLWLNGQTVVHSVDLVALGRGSNWNIAAGAIAIGRKVLNGCEMKVRRFVFLKGASVPSIWDAPRYAADLYRRGKFPEGSNPLVYMLNEGTGAPAETQGRAGTATLSGVTWGTI